MSFEFGPQFGAASMLVTDVGDGQWQLWIVDDRFEMSVTDSRHQKSVCSKVTNIGKKLPIDSATLMMRASSQKCKYKKANNIRLSSTSLSPKSIYFNGYTLNWLCYRCFTLQNRHIYETGMLNKLFSEMFCWNAYERFIADMIQNRLVNRKLVIIWRAQDQRWLSRSVSVTSGRFYPETEFRTWFNTTIFM